MKRDPTDPDGEFERRNYSLNKYCAKEGAYEANEWCEEKLNKISSDYEPPHDAPIQRASCLTITDLVHEVINQREIIGRATYHRPLTAFDGRDTLQDAIEEAADLLQYLVKLKVEREGDKGATHRPLVSK